MAEILLTPFLNKNLKFFNRVFYHNSSSTSRFEYA